MKRRTALLPDVSCETPIRVAPVKPLPPLPPLLNGVRERLDLFLALLQTWSRTVSLVSRHDLPHLQARHIDDSLQLIPLLPATGTLIDLGSGAGFPGLVLSIATDRPIHLVESDQRKAAFLREAARHCGTAATIHATRLEHADLPPAACITARALAPLSTLLFWTAPLLAAGGIALFPKGAQAEQELTLAATEWHMHLQRWQSRTNADATILQISAPTRRNG